jgi:hypothetical protein
MGADSEANTERPGGWVAYAAESFCENREGGGGVFLIFLSR